MNLKIYEKTKYNNIYKHIKNGTYAIDLSLGYDEYGRRIRTTRTGIKTEKEARIILNNEERKKVIKQSITITSNFEDGLNEYYEYCLYQKRLKETTIRNKKGRFNINIIPFFKNKKIVKITDKDIVEWHKWLDKKELDAESKNTLHKQLSAYLNWLIEYKKFAIINPCKLVKNYKIPKKEILYYSIEEINSIFNCIENDTEKEERIKLLMIAILKLFFFGGYRVGELFGLKFKDIKADILNCSDFDDEIAIDISQTVYYSKGGWIESDGKTENSLNRDWIGKGAIIYLAKYVQYMRKNFCTFSQNDYIFLNPETNKIYCPETIRDHFNYYINKANLKHIALKDLRHSCATFLLSLGYSLEEVKDKLRHTSLKTTEKHYATFYDKVRKNRAKDIDKYA